MATSGMSYAVHYELGGRTQDNFLQDFSRMRIRQSNEHPVLYVAMATWIPKCNMYHHHNNNNISDISQSSIDEPSQQQNDKNSVNVEIDRIDNNKKELTEKLTITPQKVSSPKQLQKKLESEKKRLEKQQLRDECEKKRLEEKERVRLEKLQQKQEKHDRKQKELEIKLKEKEMKDEQKRKEKEEKELKRKEKEEKEEQKRKEKEQDKLRKQQELDEKLKEKHKQEEQKQKAAAAFVNFFVPKKPDINERKIDDCNALSSSLSSIFMPFEIKSDMRLPPIRRSPMTDTDKSNLIDYLTSQSDGSLLTYLNELKDSNKTIRKCSKTWQFDADQIDDDAAQIVEDSKNFGESICEDVPKFQKMRVKFFKFHENRRPPYFGTWRKKSQIIKAKKPFLTDKGLFDYDVDSDDDWEEEEQGESLNGSDDEDKDNDVENDDYEVDNEFFVPHGHLSDDEIDEEANTKLSPESLKQKLKLLKDEFDFDMKLKTEKIKPRSIGCIWYDNKNGQNVDEIIDQHLQPYAIITNCQIIINNTVNDMDRTISKSSVKVYKKLDDELIPVFLKHIHGSIKRKQFIVADFINMNKDNNLVDVSKNSLIKSLKVYAQWRKCTEDGPMLNKYCWCVKDDVSKKYNLDLGVPG